MGSIATLTSSNFLRVADKFFSEFILYDPAVGSGARLLYMALFRHAKDGICQLPQEILGKLCDRNLRSIQTYLRTLSALQYIRIEPRPNGRNAYRLLLSKRARFFIAQAASDLINVDGNDQGEEFSSDHAKIFRMGGENSSPIYKSNKSIKNPPLSPHSPARRESTPSARASFPSTTPVPNPQAGGWGDFHSRKKQQKAPSFQTANALFERFFAAYPRKEAKEMARSVWHQLWRRGVLPALDSLLAALDRFRSSTSWNREHGRFVPFLVNWLRGQRWADAPDASESSSPGVQSAPSASPEKAEQIRSCMQRLEDQHRTDPALAAARPLFEDFLSRFADGQRKRGPAWGLWSLLYRLGKAPTVAQASSSSDVGVLSFLQDWQRGAHVTA